MTEANDQRKAECQYCHKALAKIPAAKTKCPYCGEYMLVRTHLPDHIRVVVTKEEADKMALAAQDYWLTESRIQAFTRGASETYALIYNDFDKLEAQAKQAFKSGNRDEAWRLHNQALIEAVKGQNWESRLQGVYFSMACQLAAEGRYKESPPFFGKALYWSCFGVTITEVKYRQAISLEKGKEQLLNFALDVQRALPPFILDPVITALQLADMKADEFSVIFLKENGVEQALATKLIATYERIRFEAPQPEAFWKIIGNVIRDNLEIRERIQPSIQV